MRSRTPTVSSGSGSTAHGFVDDTAKLSIGLLMSVGGVGFSAGAYDMLVHVHPSIPSMRAVRAGGLAILSISVGLAAALAPGLTPDGRLHPVAADIADRDPQRQPGSGVRLSAVGVEIGIGRARQRRQRSVQL